MSRFKAANEIDRRTGTNILGIIVIDQLTVFGRGEVQMSDCSYMVPNLTEGSFYRSEIIIKKSRFITSVGHTQGAEASEAFLEKIRREFSDARHNCYAFNAGRGGETAFAGCSDDGEPKGTAGRPMLNVLVHSQIGEITVVVTRYFGGILLGTGGLVRAYQDSVKEALAKLPLKIKEDLEELHFTADSTKMHIVEQIVRKHSGRITGRNFSGTGCMIKITAGAANALQIKQELDLLNR